MQMSEIEEVDNEENNNTPVFELCDERLVSSRVMLLLWPIAFAHDDEHKDCRLFPISPLLNCRDVGESRIVDPMKPKLLKNSCCHGILGQMAKVDVGATPPQGYVETASIFNRYASLDSFVVDCKIYFTNTLEIDGVKEKVKAIIKKIRSNKKYQLPNHDELIKKKFELKIDKKIENATDPSMLLLFLMEYLDKCYNGFNSTDCYLRLKLVSLNNEKNNTEAELPPCIVTAGIEVQATFLFQKMMFPYCLSFMNGNHRHARMLQLAFPSCPLAIRLQNDSDDTIANTNVNDISKDGYILPATSGVGVTATFENDEASVDLDTYKMKYSIYNIVENTLLSDLTSNQMKQISILQNDLLVSSQAEEIIWDILNKCKSIMEIIKVDDTCKFAEVDNAIQDYLKMTPSALHNSERNKQSSPYHLMRFIKERLRTIIAKVFYPNVRVITKYKAGVTYIEKMTTTKRLDRIFEKPYPEITPKLLSIFILLDNIYVATEIGTFMNLLKNSYKRQHANQSMHHKISHTEVWDYPDVFADMNIFVAYIIKVLKVIPTTSNGILNELINTMRTSDSTQDEDVLNDDESKEDDGKRKRTKVPLFLSLLRQKVSHCCQSYAFFVAMAVAETIGLFPIISGCDWKLDNNRHKATVGRYNIFRLMMHLFTFIGSGLKSSSTNVDVSGCEKNSSTDVVVIGSGLKSSSTNVDVSGCEKNSSTDVVVTAFIVPTDNIVVPVQGFPPEELFQQTIATAFFNEIYLCVDNIDGACFPLTYSKFKQNKGVEVVEKFCNEAIQSNIDLVKKFYSTMNDIPMRA